MPSASDGLAAVAGVGEGDERTIASCPRALAVIEVEATKQNNQRRVICKILSGFPRDRDSTKPIEEGKLYCAMSRHAIGIRSLGWAGVVDAGLLFARVLNWIGVWFLRMMR